jgi:hypothetical protein
MVAVMTVVSACAPAEQPVMVDRAEGHSAGRADTLNEYDVRRTVIATESSSLGGENREWVRYGTVEATLVEDLLFGPQTVDLAAREYVLEVGSGMRYFTADIDAAWDATNAADMAFLIWYRPMFDVGHEPEGWAGPGEWIPVALTDGSGTTIDTFTRITFGLLYDDATDRETLKFIVQRYEHPLGEGDGAVLVDDISLGTNRPGDPRQTFHFKIFPVPYRDFWDIEGRYDYDLRVHRFVE